MIDAPPDRLSVDPKSPFYDEGALARGVGVRFRGVDRRDVEEYCVRESWIRAPAGKARDRKGAPLVIKMTGGVEPYFISQPEGAGLSPSPATDDWSGLPHNPSNRAVDK